MWRKKIPPPKKDLFKKKVAKKKEKIQKKDLFKKKVAKKKEKKTPPQKNFKVNFVFLLITLLIKLVNMII